MTNENNNQRNKLETMSDDKEDRQTNMLHVTYVLQEKTISLL